MHNQERSWLKNELPGWVEKGIVTQEQADALAHKYALAELAPTNWGKRISYAVSGLAIFIGVMGVFLLISANWDNLDRFFQMAIVLLPLLASYVFGLRFARRGDQDKASLVFFLSGLLLGANIYLQAQIFHIEAYWPDGILWWMIGMVGPMLFFNSNLHGLVVQFLFSFWIGTQFAHNQFTLLGYVVFGLLLWQTWRNPFWLMLLFSLAHILVVLLRLDLYLLLDSLWIGRKLPPIAAFMALAAGFVYFTVNLLQGQYGARFAYSMQTLGLFALLLLVYLGTFSFAGEMYIQANYTVLGFALLAVVGYGFWRSPRRFHDVLVAGIIGGIVVATIIGTWQYFYSNETRTYDYQHRYGWFGGVLQLAANAAFLGIAILRINYGRLHKLKTEFMAGIAMILLLAFTRYLDYIQDYITGGLLFIGCAFLLFYLNRYWDKKYAQS
jgi:uncharacterized membrane protein